MINNYYTLRRWTDEQSPVLQQARILEVFSQTRDRLSIGFITAGREHRLLEISAQPQLAYAAVHPAYQRKKKNAVDLLPEIKGHSIVRLKTYPFNRILEMELDHHVRIVSEFYGHPNTHVIDEQNIILNSFKDPKRWKGQKYISPDPEALTNQKNSGIGTYIEPYSDLNDLKAFLSSGGLGFNKTLYLEFMYRLSQSGLPDNPDAAIDILREINSEILTSPPRIYRKKNKPLFLSLTSLRYLAEMTPDTVEETYHSINDALLAIITEKQKYDDSRKRIQDILKVCKTKTRKNELLIGALEADIGKAGRHKMFETMAHLLNAHFHQIHRGMASITLENSFDPDGGDIEIPLDPELPVQENISAYYVKSKKLRQSVSKIEERITELRKENRYLSEVSATLSNDSEPRAKLTEKIYHDFIRKKWLKPEKGLNASKKREAEVPEFREYLIEKRWRLWVGQNDDKNDALTFRYAKKDDYWFHARGVPGSHVVLKRDHRSEQPSRSVIEAAASIAAFFSKAKTSGLAPVIFTQKKYVRKARQGRPGQVVIEREETLMVEPRDPGKSELA